MPQLVRVTFVALDHDLVVHAGYGLKELRASFSSATGTEPEEGLLSSGCTWISRACRWLIALVIPGTNENPTELLVHHQSGDRGVVSSEIREGVLQPGWYTPVRNGHKILSKCAENPINEPIHRTHQGGLERTQANS